MQQVLENDIKGSAQTQVRHHYITSSDNVRLHVLEAGNPDGPAIVFLSGYLQSSYSYRRQLADPQLTDNFHLFFVDLRGQGLSDKPERREAYFNTQLNADDIAAVIQGFGQSKVVLVGWSAAGLPICDYTRIYGEAHLAGIVLVAAVTSVDMTDPEFLKSVGDGLGDVITTLTSKDVGENYQALVGFTKLLTANPVPNDEFLQTLANSLIVPPTVREYVFVGTAQVSNKDILTNLSVPALIVHGELDGISKRVISDINAQQIPNSHLSLYADAGHAPFLDAPERFNRELAEFVSYLA